VKNLSLIPLLPRARQTLLSYLSYIIYGHLILFGTGIIPASVYGDVASRIASHGYVVLGIWTLTALPTSQIKATWLKDIDIWLQVNTG
jgi:hypothetical protein